MVMDEMLGKRFGKLHVAKYVGLDKFNRKKYFCWCECDKYIIRTGTQLRSGVISCGCHRRKAVQNDTDKVREDLRRCFQGDLKHNPKVGIVITQLSRKLNRLRKGVDNSQTI